MKRVNVKNMTVAELVQRFIAIGLEQDEVLLMGDTHKFKPLFWQMVAVEMN